MRKPDADQTTNGSTAETAEAPEPVLIRQLHLKNFLSFGPEAEPVPLRALNVIIGANGSGKSNFMEGISLFRAAPNDLAGPIREGGGVTDWIYKGANGKPATIEAHVEYPNHPQMIRHMIAFTEEAQRFRLVDERIENVLPDQGQNDVFFFYRFQNGRPMASINGQRRKLQLEEAELDASILSQRKDPDLYPEMTYLGRQYAQIRLYREWSFGRFTVPRRPQPADQRNDALSEDFQNLGLVLNRLKLVSDARVRLLEFLKDFMQDVTQYEVLIQGGTVQLFFLEGRFDIPATRLSDGTLRFLCLLVILLNPSPPPLVCIEEPELGLHPDILPGLADLLIEASSRMQIVVTTHSNMLVDALTSTPESVLVCNKEDGQTQLRRLDGDALIDWLEDYRLGQVWLKGAIGGTRW